MSQNKYELRFDEIGHASLWCPYNALFIKDLKFTFNDSEAQGAEWESTLMCWRIYTGWKGCEDWITKLLALLDMHYPDKF